MPFVIIAVAIIIAAFFAVLAKRFERTVEGKELPDSDKKPLVSILIPTYKSENEIGKTLDAVNKSDYPNKDIMVINDSDDKTPDIARRRGAWVLQNDQRRGKGHALNTALKHVKGEFLLFLDSDTELEPDTLSKLVSSFYHHHSNDSSTAMVVPKYIANNQHLMPARISHLEQCSHQSWIKAQMSLGSILSIRGSCMLVKRDAFEKTGGFSTTVLEDGDLSARMHKLGLAIKYEPRARVHIAEPETFGELLKAKKRYGKGTLFCALNHKSVYLASKHAVMSFYPGFLLIALVLIYLATAPLINILVIILLLTIAPLAATVTTSNPETDNENFMKVISLCFMPLVIFTYLLGVASGIRDKVLRRPELKFKDW
jgi:cellulose synthase/poly-beta-1,6-N-acetylglucosamine synthase-like glycosyltransferase